MKHKTIQLNHGLSTIVDETDFESLSKYKWRAIKFGNLWYAVRSTKACSIYMHKQILGSGKGIHTDHINGDSLDNRRENIREVNQAENQWNTGKKLNNTSGYKGVTWDKKYGKWSARITTNKVHKFIGYFNTSKKAGEAYATYAEETRGKKGK